MSHSDHPLNCEAIANLLAVCTGGRVYPPSEDSSTYVIRFEDQNVARNCCEELSDYAQMAGQDVMMVQYDGSRNPRIIDLYPALLEDNYFIYGMLKEKLQQHYHATVEMRIDSSGGKSEEDEVTLYIYLSSMSEVNAVTKDFQDSSNTIDGVSVVSDTAGVNYTLGISANALAKQPQLLKQVLANPSQVDVNGYIRSRYIMPTFEIGDSKPTSEAADTFLRSLTSSNDNGMIIMPNMDRANTHINRLRKIFDQRFFAVDYSKEFELIAVKYQPSISEHAFKLRHVLGAIAREQKIENINELIQNQGVWILIDPVKLDAHPDFLNQLEKDRDAINTVHTLRNVGSASDLLRLARNITPGHSARGRQF